MAQATTLPFSGVKVLLESPSTPNTFIAPCGLKERSFTLTKETGETVIPDCDDEAAAPFVIRDSVSRSASISGQGLIARESLGLWRAAYHNDDAIRCRIELAGTAAQGGGFWLGSFHLTSLEVGATWKERCTISIEMQSTGTVSFTPAN